ncbi:MAG: SGNH/GDSL hydrolase family protein [Candidatus Parabeggiatoa sp.]|nr:SGNH/GDSL hydrolase family protein [Candidatus Parabeggiatoa sp.]
MKKEIKYYLLSSLVIAVVGLSAIELTTRIISGLSGKGFTLSLDELEPYDKQVESLYQWHPFTGITFMPNNSFQGGHPYQKEPSSIVVDKHGFLANVSTLKYQKSSNEIRIATIGASTTANIYLSYDDNWPGYLGRLVQNALPDKKIKVINAGVPGFDTAQSIGNLALRVIPFQPDIVIIYHAYNDLKAIGKEVNFQPDYSHIHTKPYGFHNKPNWLIRWLDHSMFYVRLRQQYRDYNQNAQKLEALKNERLGKSNRLNHIPQEAKKIFEQHIHTLVSIAKGQGAEVVLSSFATLNDPQLDYSDFEVFNPLSKFQRGQIYALMHFTPGLTSKAIFEGINSYNEILKTIAIQEETGWVDNATLVPHEDQYFLDRVHFSKEGAARMANNFFPVVLERLQQSQ